MRCERISFSCRYSEEKVFFSNRWENVDVFSAFTFISVMENKRRTGSAHANEENIEKPPILRCLRNFFCCEYSEEQIFFPNSWEYVDIVSAFTFVHAMENKQRTGTQRMQMTNTMENRIYCVVQVTSPVVNILKGKFVCEITGNM